MGGAVHGLIGVFHGMRQNPIATIVLIVTIFAAALIPLPAMPPQVADSDLGRMDINDRILMKLVNNLTIIGVVILFMAFALFARSIGRLLPSGNGFLVMICVIIAVLVMAERYITAFVRISISDRNRLS